MPEQPIPDNVNVGTWKDLATDPGTAVILGFVALGVPFGLIMAKPEVAPFVVSMYPLYTTGIVGLVTAHAWKDADKTRYLCQRKEPSDGNPEQPRD